MTHAHFYNNSFDQVVNEIGVDGGWIFGRYRDSYIGLYTAMEATFAVDDPDEDLYAAGTENVWIAEVGSKALNESFEIFMQTLTASTVIYLKIVF